MKIDFQRLAQPAPEQAEQFIAESAAEQARELGDGLRELLRIMAEFEFKRLRGELDED